MSGFAFFSIFVAEILMHIYVVFPQAQIKAFAN